jgi:hypothetical protein
MKKQKIKNDMDFSGVPGEPLSYLTVKLLKKSHKGLEVNPFQAHAGGPAGSQAPSKHDACPYLASYFPPSPVSGLFFQDLLNNFCHYLNNTRIIINRCNLRFPCQNPRQVPFLFHQAAMPHQDRQGS